MLFSTLFILFAIAFNHVAMLTVDNGKYKMLLNLASAYETYPSSEVAMEVLKSNPNDVKAVFTIAFNLNSKALKCSDQDQLKQILLQELVYDERLLQMTNNSTMYLPQYAHSLTVLGKYSEALPIWERIANSDSISAAKAKEMVVFVRQQMAKGNTVK